MRRQRTSYSDMFAELQRQQETHARAIRKLQNTPRLSMPLRLVSSTFPPVDPLPNEKIVYQADSSKGVNWELIYNGGSSSSLKWEYGGGPPVYAEVNTRESAGTVSTWVDITTTGPSITLAKGGDYRLQAYAQCESDSASANRMGIGISIAGAAPASTEQALAAPIYLLNASNGYHSAVIDRVVQINAGSVVKLQYFTAEIANHFWFNRRLFITPVRIG